MRTILKFPRTKAGRRKLSGGPKRPMLIPFQPEPMRTMVAYQSTSFGEWVTAITRIWRNGEERMCRLCDGCYARDGVCLITINDKLEPDEAAMFDTRGYAMSDSGEPAKPQLRIAQV